MKFPRAGERLRSCCRRLLAARARVAVSRRSRPWLERLEHRLAPAAHDMLATAIPLVFDSQLQAQGSGTLATSNQVDLYAVQLNAGDEVTADVTAQNLGSPQSELRLFNSSGQQLAFAANTASLDTSLTVDALGSGFYYVGVSSNGNGSYDPNTTGSGSGGLSAGSYTLNLTPTNNPFTLAQTVTANTVVAGMYVNGTTAYYSFTATTNGGLSASVIPVDATAFLPRLTLYGASGQLLIQSDAAGANNAPAQLDQHLQPGTYYLGVSSVTDRPAGNQSYALDTTFGQALPPFQGLPVGNGPDAVAVGDFSHDGNLDIVTANSNDGTVSVLLGRGDGTFLPAVTYNVGNHPDAVAVGDFRHDGNLDIVTANSNDGTVSVLLGEGDGTFLPAATYNVGNEPYSVAVGDFSHDGNLDIVTANSGDDTVSVLSGEGDGTFLPAATYNVGNGPDSVAVGDFNHDGNLDIVTANYGDAANEHAGTVSVLLGNGDGTFLPAATYNVGSFPHSVAVGDLNNDGNLDIVTANLFGSTANEFDGSVSVLLGQGDGTFLPAATYDVGNEPYSVAVGDFSHDGNLDIVTANLVDSTVSVLLGQGDGTFLPAATYNVGSDPESVAVGNFSHDGNLDIVTANYVDSTASVLLGRGDGTFLSAPTNNVGNGAEAVAEGDFSHDGNLDIVTANSGDNTVSVLLGRGDGTFLPAATYNVGNGPDSVAVGDFSHDGNLDIVTANQFDNTVSVLLGRGDGTFLPAVTYNVGSSPSSVAVADFNNDGNLDIVTANLDFDPSTDTYGVGTVSVLLGVGDGTFLPAATYDVGSYPDAIAVGDFNHDGNPDIVTANSDDETVSVLLGRGDGTFLPATTYDVGLGPASVAVGDFNNDGNLDIVTANYDSTVSVLLGLGDGTFTPDTFSSPGLTPGTTVLGTNFVAVGDFNNDGNLDIVTANNADNAVSVLLGQGNGQFQPSTPANGIAIRNVPFLQDLNGDGIRDELILNNEGALLFRQGLGTDGLFAPPKIINLVDPNNPTGPIYAARDATVFQTADGWAVAAVDDTGNTVSIYTWDAATHSLRRSFGFATGNLPVRIAAGDLNGQEVNGHSLDDLVVANDFDNSVTIALQQTDGTFTTLTRPTGVGPSDIAFANRGGENGPAIVVSDQVSGDLTVLLNDSTPSSNPTFSQEYRYRAGSGLFDISLDANTGEPTVLSQLQTVGIVAGTFEPSSGGSDDLIVLNQNAKSFTLLPNLAQGSFGNPQVSNTYFPTSAQASQVVSLTLRGDTLPSVATLMQNLNQIWIYRNNGNGTFATPSVANGTVIDAGNDPSGLSVATVDGKLALLVGNSFGDILTLLYDPNLNEGQGGFAPDRANLQGAPLAVGTIEGTGEQYAVVADQKLDQVWLYSLISGTTRFGSPVPVSAGQQLPPLAPGAVQTFYVPGDPNPYLAVAYSLSNDLLLYQYNPAAGQFNLVNSYNVGDDPVSITVGDINGDGIPDLAVANQGSNDISLLIGSLVPSTGQWIATSYQRVSSGGSGPVGVSFVEQPGSSHGPDLLATNSDGTVALVPGIGSGGTGSGFFAVPNTRSVTLRGTPLGPISDGLLPTTQGIFRVNLNTLAITPAFASTDLTAFSVDANGDVVAGFSGGSVELLTPNSAGQLAPDLLFRDAQLTDPDALQVVANGRQTDILATNAGEGSLFVFALSEGIAVPGTQSAFESRGQSAEVQPVSEAGLFLVAAFVTDAGEGAGQGGGAALAGVEFGVGAGPFAAGNLAVPLAVLLVGGAGAGDDPIDPGAPPVGPPGPAAERGSPLNDFIIGVGEGLRTIRGQIRDQRGAPGADAPEKPNPDPAQPQGSLNPFFRLPGGSGPMSEPPGEAGWGALLLALAAADLPAAVAPAPAQALPRGAFDLVWVDRVFESEVAGRLPLLNEPGAEGAGGVTGAPKWAAVPAERATDAVFALSPLWSDRGGMLWLALVLTGAVLAPRQDRCSDDERSHSAAVSKARDA
ncbi:MAG TPA: VCBS repeat-containing protein [Gemmataceae bacterium]|nr:VCBS repeat-containing protein [Gemmataceae bacterium]